MESKQLTNITHTTENCMTADMAHVDPMIQAVLKADHLSEETRMGYSKKAGSQCNKKQRTYPGVDSASCIMACTESAELDL